MQHSDEEAKSAGPSLSRSVPTPSWSIQTCLILGLMTQKASLMTKESPDDVLPPLNSHPPPSLLLLISCTIGTFFSQKQDLSEHVQVQLGFLLPFQVSLAVLFLLSL